MSFILIKLAQFTYIIWPLFIITAFAYSLLSPGGRNWFRTLGRRIQKNLFYTWLILFSIWLITLFAGEPVPTLLPEPANSIMFFAGLAVLLLIEANQLRFLPIRIQARLDMHKARAIHDLNQMDPGSFEELVAETYRALGYQARRTGRSGDHGIDVELRPYNGERWIVQCKRYRDPVGEAVVRELYGTMVSEKARRAILVTSAEITPPAETWARGKPIQLIDGHQFLNLMEKAHQKNQGSFFERFTIWLDRWITGAQTPPSLRQVPTGSGINNLIEQTRPTRIVLHQAPADERLLTPICPRCRIPMDIHPHHPGRNLYRCKNYPTCRVVVD
ncbi:MAG: restriction endonuclease, partial [Anaerolineaceae bacterium]|nr:restriction endonuclease [Anaerolineaceae bacterium]